MRLRQIFFTSFVLIVLSFILAQYADFFSNRSKYQVRINQVINSKKRMIDRYFNTVLKSETDFINKDVKNATKENVYIYKYINDSLVFWSSNAVPVPNINTDNAFGQRIIQFSSSFYYSKTFSKDSLHLVGIYQIKSRYPYDNKLLHSGFNHDFRLPQSSTLSFDKTRGAPIYDEDGIYLFTLNVNKPDSGVNTRSVLSVIFLFIGLIGLGYSIYLLLDTLEESKKTIWVIVAVGGILLIRILSLLLSVSFSPFLLFDPFVYADSLFVPSLGDLLINSLLVFLTALIINRFVSVKHKYKNSTAINDLGKHLGFNLLLLVYFVYAHYFCHSLIFNSSISFQPNEINQITVSSLIGYLINGINFLSLALVVIWLFKKVIPELSFKFFFFVYIIPAAFLLLVLFITGYPLDIISAIFYPGFIILMFIVRSRGGNINNYSFLVIFVILFSVYLLFVVGSKSNQKESEIRKSLALSLANEHDPVAEFLLEDISRQILTDDSIIEKLSGEQINIDEFYEFLKKNYFTGYWNKYDLQITLCGPEDSVLIEIPEYVWFYCYGFFDDIIGDIGFRMPESNFYYLENYTGRISYLGRFSYIIPDTQGEITLFIELDSRLTSEMLGYPELLLNEKFHQQRKIDNYSYAKYHSGDLVSQFGDFSYSLSSDIFGDSNQEMYFTRLDDYDHLVYRSGDQSIIVVSRPKIKFIDRLIAFSYLFLFYYISLLIYVSIHNLNNKGEKFLGSLRNKIQFSIITILFISMLLIAASTIWLNARSYRLNQNKILHEKIHSVLIELTHKLLYEDVLTPYWSTDKYDNLDQLLIKFSDVFYTDINLYDPAGELLATSRNEIFEMGLQGTKMDPVAFYKLNVEKRSQYIHRENISELSYFSAYVPFENAEGKLLAYLNLPYFTKQKELQLAISALVVTIINIYVILFLVTIIVTILISEQITRPLEILQESFRQFKLGGRYEQIQYKRKDEIGKLVVEYNRMVAELERSVDLLARSERESAWREMAKQIAHEIKNPLTPMRLSVQQLQKSWRDKREDYDAYFNRVSNTLIEQIDNLSAIASAFSSFAKMPVAKITNVDIIKVLKNVVELFEGNKNYVIEFDTDIEHAKIKADKEQISRVFINLIKNGIQAIPEDRKGLIVVKAYREDNYLNILISDNGKGISEDIKTKLFMPNFTTKSSGMGLGLAIVRNILDQVGGEISFNTKFSEGSEFHLKFPLLES